MTYNQGYTVKRHAVPVKRYCQMLNLKNSPKLIAEYRKVHSREKAWPEIRAGIPLCRYFRDGNLYTRFPVIHDCRNPS